MRTFGWGAREQLSSPLPAMFDWPARIKTMCGVSSVSVFKVLDAIARKFYATALEI